MEQLQEIRIKSSGVNKRMFTRVSNFLERNEESAFQNDAARQNVLLCNAQCLLCDFLFCCPENV